MKNPVRQFPRCVFLFLFLLFLFPRSPLFGSPGPLAKFFCNTILNPQAPTPLTVESSSEESGRKPVPEKPDKKSKGRPLPYWKEIFQKDQEQWEVLWKPSMQEGDWEVRERASWSRSWKKSWSGTEREAQSQKRVRGAMALHLLQALLEDREFFPLPFWQRQSLQVWVDRFRSQIPEADRSNLSIGSSPLRFRAQAFIKNRVYDLPWFFIPVILRPIWDRGKAAFIYKAHIRRSLWFLFDDPHFQDAIRDRYGLSDEYIFHLLYFDFPRHSYKGFVRHFMPHSLVLKRMISPLVGLFLLAGVGVNPLMDFMLKVSPALPLGAYLKAIERVIINSEGHSPSSTVTRAEERGEERAPLDGKQILSIFSSKMGLLRDSTGSAVDVYSQPWRDLYGLGRYRSETVATFGELADVLRQYPDTDVLIITAHGEPDNFIFGSSQEGSSETSQGPDPNAPTSLSGFLESSLFVQDWPQLKPGSVLILTSCQLGQTPEGSDASQDPKWVQMARKINPKGQTFVLDQIIYDAPGPLDNLKGLARLYEKNPWALAQFLTDAVVFQGAGLLLMLQEPWDLFLEGIQGTRANLKVYDGPNGKIRIIPVSASTLSTSRLKDSPSP